MPFMPLQKELGRASGVGVTINMALLTELQLGELAHGFGIEQEISADSRRRLRFLESAMKPPPPLSVSVFSSPLSPFPPVGSWIWD